MSDTTQQATAPGLERMSINIWDIPYAELTPRLQKVVRTQVARDAAEDMLEALKIAVSQGCNCWNSGEDGHTPDCFIPKAEKAIAKGEGR